MDIRAVADANFEDEVLKSSALVLVDFWAPWCGPCKTMAPILSQLGDQLSEKFPGLVSIVKLDVDDNPETAKAYNIRSIPTLIAFKGGKPIATQTGTYPQRALYEWVVSII